jgi:competence protein ComGF
MKRHKLMAYTIAELLISMLIMSVVVLVSYVVLSSLTRQLHLFIETEETLLTYASFKNTLKREVFESKLITVENNKISLKFENKIINYTFDESFIYRKDSRIGKVDAFSLRIEKIRPIFIKKIKGKIISSLILDLHLFKEKTSIIFTKKYGADIVINDFF